MRLIIINQNDTFIADSLCYLGISYKPTPADITSALGAPPAKSHYLRLVAGGCSFDYGPILLQDALVVKQAIEQWLLGAYDKLAKNKPLMFDVQVFMDSLGAAAGIAQQPISIAKFKDNPPVDIVLDPPADIAVKLPGKLRTRKRRAVKDRKLRVVGDNSKGEPK